MTQIVSFQKAKDERGPHLSGDFICARCRYEWTGSAPVGTIDCECPACGAVRGHIKAHVLPSVGDVRFVCKTCDSDLFSIRPDGKAMCAGCGEHHWPIAGGDQ